MITARNDMKILAQLALLLLTACGNGNGASAQSQSTSPPPTAPQVINGIAVPPEPDPVANTATLLGVDSNNNGVRDDVERQIATKYGANATQYAAAIQVAKSDQTYLVANGDPTKSTAATSNAVISGACISESFNTEWLAGSKAIDYLSPLTFNTPERMAAYRATSAASTEVATKIPAHPCQ
jgi:hypothetical protein